MSTHDVDQTNDVKKQYLDIKKLLTDDLRQLVEILENVGDKPLSGEERKKFMNKFDTIDRQLLNKFDWKSLMYFDYLETQQN